MPVKNMVVVETASGLDLTEGHCNLIDKGMDKYLEVCRIFGAKPVKSSTRLVMSSHPDSVGRLLTGRPAIIRMEVCIDWMMEEVRVIPLDQSDCPVDWGHHIGYPFE